MKKLPLYIATLLLIIVGFYTTSSLANHHHDKDIVAIAMHEKDLSTFDRALKTTGLVDTLKGKGPFTVFAPTNEAFGKIPPGELTKLLNDKKKLTTILTYHVVSGDMMASSLTSGSVKTVEGQDITITKDDKGVMVNNAKVIKADIKASNGVIHVINTVLMPPAAG